VFRIRDIFGTDLDPWTCTLITDLDLAPDPALFLSDFKLFDLFCLLLSVGAFTSVFKDKKSLGCH
jgi:hypothetical protein